MEQLLNRPYTLRTGPNVPAIDPGIIPDKAFKWQRDGALALARFEKHGLFHACGLGKSAALLLALRLANANKSIILTRAMGRFVYARDSVWAWPGVPVAVLIGRSGNDSPSAKAQLRAAEKYAAMLRERGANVIVTRTMDEALQARVVVTGYETLSARVSHGAPVDWDVAIADESHMIKGWRADRTVAAHVLAQNAAVRWIATATPVPDRIRDLWAQWAFCAPKQAEGSWKWKHRYCGMHRGRFAMDDTGLTHAAELSSRVQAAFDVKTRAEIRDLLPPATNDIIRIPNDDASYPSHRDIESALGYAADKKTDWIVSRVRDALIGNEKVVVVGNRLAWVPRIVREIEHALGNHSARKRLWIRTLTGEVPVAERLALADEFRAAPAPAVAVCTMDSIKAAIDMQDADEVIAAALPWAAGDIIQFKGRFQRPGQSRPVTFLWPVLEGSIDEEVEALVLSKLSAVEAVGVSTEEPDAGLSSVSDRETADALSDWLRRSSEEAAG